MRCRVAIVVGIGIDIRIDIAIGTGIDTENSLELDLSSPTEHFGNAASGGFPFLNGIKVL